MVYKILKILKDLKDMCPSFTILKKRNNCPLLSKRVAIMKKLETNIASKKFIYS